MKPAGLEQIGALFAGTDRSWSTPRLQALAAGLPVAAEQARCGVEQAQALRWEALRAELWERTRARAAERGWSDLAAGIVAAVDILASPAGTTTFPIDTTEAAAPWDRSPFATVAGRLDPSLPGLRAFAQYERLSTAWRGLRGPHVRVLLSDGTSARVFFADGPGDNEPSAQARALRQLGLGGGRWGYDRPVSGASAMAARVLRAAAQRHPKLGDLGVVGVTGEVDEHGRLLPVNALRDKVLGFFRAHPDGLCVVPQGSEEELAALAPDHARKFQPAHGDRLTGDQWGRLWNVGSVQLLLLRLGIAWDDGPICRFFAAVRDASARTQDWRGRTRHPSDLVEIPLVEAGERWPEPLRRTLAREVGSPAGTVIGGKPGSGKSMLIRQAWFELNRGTAEVSGPAVLAVARRWRAGDDVAEPVAATLGGWSGAEVRDVLSDPALAGGVTLLVDGLDELPPTLRREVILSVQRWKGPWVLATRTVPEVLPAARRMEVQDLEPKQAQALFEVEARPDLARAVVGWARPTHATEQALAELARTPLGVSLLSLSFDGRHETRQELLRDGILHLVQRAAAEGRLTDQIRRRFERAGPRILGAAAWRMLREGRAHLLVEDLGAAEDALPGSREDADVLHACIEQAGFVQPAGPGRWEFSHRTFAEYAAALHLHEEGEAGLADAVDAVGQPGTNEVVVHLGALAPDAVPVMNALLRARSSPLTSIALATRIGMEATTIGEERPIVEVAARRMRFVASFPDATMPADLADAEALFAFVQRHSGVLKRHAPTMVAACPQEVRDWLDDRIPIQQDEVPWNLRDRSVGYVDRSARDLARRLAEALGLPVPVRGRIRLGLPIDPRDLGRVEALRHDPQLGHTATNAWFATAPPARLLEQLGRLSETREHAVEILGAVASHGSPLQVREALLRVSALALDFPVRRWDDDPSHHHLPGLGDLTEQQWLDRWDWAWSVGMLGGGPPAAEPLYAKLLREPNAVARWRAIVAIDRIGRQGRAHNEPTALTAEQVAELRLSARDMDRRVRVEALSVLAAGRRTALEDLRPSLVSPDLYERTVALDALIGAGFALPVDLVLVALAEPPAATKPEVPWADQPPRAELTPFERSLPERGDAARSRLIERLAKSTAEADVWRACFDVLGEGSVGEVAAQLLSRGSWSLAEDGAVRAELAKHPNPAARAWLVERLRWRQDPDILALLEQLISDPDVAVAEAAREAVERARTPREEPTWRTDIGRRAVDAVPAESAPSPRAEQALSVEQALSFPGPGTNAAPGSDSSELLELTTFEDAWRWLGDHDLQWQTFADQEGSWTEEGIDFLVELTAQAAAQNRDLARPVLAHLARLYTPASRPSVVAALGTPRLGLWAAALLDRETREPDLLGAFRRSEAASIAAAGLAVGSPVQPAAARAFIEALLAEAWPVDPPDDSPWPSATGWMKAFRQLAGLEGLAALLLSDPPPAVSAHVLRAVEADAASFKTAISTPSRRDLAAWARRRWADQPPAEAARVLALLALVGSDADADEWAERLSAGAELPPTVRAGGVKVVVGCGTERHVAFLRQLSTSDESLPVVAAALEGLATVADEAGSAWLLDRLVDEPPAVRRVRGRKAERDGRRDAARASGVQGWWTMGADPDEDHLANGSSWRRAIHEAVVRVGTAEQGLMLAEQLADDASAIDLAERHGRLGVHALLVLGAMRHDPGEHVIPSEVTGGGDEVAGSGVPERVDTVVSRIREVAGREPVRVAFLEAVMRGFGSTEADEWFHRLGGARPKDLARLLARLRDAPRDSFALSYMRAAGGGEAELVQLWREHGATWLWPEER